jgi:CDP-diacylglycerol--glycerol-3-phosphate 3-phosphatidyltransferase
MLGVGISRRAVYNPQAMKLNIPNQITIGRIFLAAAFFTLLGLYRPAGSSSTLLGAGFVLFVLAALSDVLDGYLARRWNQVTAFGRIVDPFVDKVLVLGAFIMLAGPDFTLSATASQLERDLPGWLTGGMGSAVQTWMVVVILAREFIVSAIRGFAESQGIEFPAIGAGKLKMLTQSFAIGSILFVLAWTPQWPVGIWVKIISVWVALIITVFSGVVYIRHSYKLLKRHDRGT